MRLCYDTEYTSARLTPSGPPVGEMHMADMPAENKKQSAQEKLGTMPIGRLLVTMSVPMMISMFI